jgi:lysophospholipase L1-like esterase
MTARATKFNVWRKDGVTGTYALIGTQNVASGGSLNFHDTTVLDGVTYFYKVQAANNGGTTPFSNEVFLTTHLAIDPLLTSPLVWYDAITDGHSGGTSIHTISDQSGNANTITMNGNDCVLRTSPFKYYENTLSDGRFTLGTRITTGRTFVLVFRVRTGDEQTFVASGSSLVADNSGGLGSLRGATVAHRCAELLMRLDIPDGSNIDPGFLGTGGGYKVNGGPLVTPFPQTSGTWSAGSGWISGSSKNLAASKPYKFQIMVFHTSANVPFDTLMNLFGIPGTGYNVDLAAFGAWNSVLSNGVEAGIVAFLKSRYSLTTAPEEHIYIGDSLTYGAGLVSNNGVYNLPNAVQADNHTNGLLSGAINLGVGSAPLGNGTLADLYYMYQTYWKALRNPNASKQVIVLWPGANDIGVLGLTASQLYTNVTNFCNQVHSDGFKVLVISCAPSQFVPGGYDLTNYATQRNAYNASMDSNHSFADGWLNYSARTDIGVDLAPTNHPENFADGIHLNQAGYVILAPLVGTALRAIP